MYIYIYMFTFHYKHTFVLVLSLKKVNSVKRMMQIAKLKV